MRDPVVAVAVTVTVEVEPHLCPICLTRWLVERAAVHFALPQRVTLGDGPATTGPFVCGHQ